MRKHLSTWHDLEFYDYQWEFFDGIINALLDNIDLISSADVEAIDELENMDIAAEFSRQSGKTTTVVHTVEFVLEYINHIFLIVFGRPIAVGIFARQQEQVKTDFDRLKAALYRSSAIAGKPKEANAHTLELPNGATCYVYPISPTSNPESKSLDLIIVEEAQLAPDDLVGVKILPMGKTTNAPNVWLGTAGYRKCTFWKLIQNGKALVYDWQRVAKDRRKMYKETNNVKHLIYEQSVKSDIKKFGTDSDMVRISYNLEWLLERGMFVTQAQLEQCRVYSLYNLDDPANKQYDHYFGLDSAKQVDRTVLKIGREIDGKLTTVYSIEIQGMNYQDQFELIADTLRKFKVIAGAIDSTGQGDFMPDLFDRLVDRNYFIMRVTFNLVSKDNMYKSWLNKILNDKFAYYYDDNEITATRFEYETANLITETKQDKYMSVHHPEEPDAHDDHPDSTVLMVTAWDEYNKNSGIVDYYKDTVAPQPAV